MSVRAGGRAAGLVVGAIAGIAVVYGTRADWVRNVLAAGSATIVSQGDSVDVDTPIIAATEEVAGQIPARTLRTLHVFGVTECLHLQRSTDGLG